MARCFLVMMASVVVAGSAHAKRVDPLSRLQAKVNQIIDATVAGNDAWNKLRELCDDIGHRLSGSPELDRAIAWAVARLKADGHENVHTEKVMVPKWVRGTERIEMLAPRPMEMVMLGLGRSPSTPKGGITAEVVVAEDEAALKALGDKVKGRIVLFDKHMPDFHPEKGHGYGETVKYRSRGPAMAAKMGAVAALVRSVTAHSLRTPHTGGTWFDKDEIQIPAAAVTTEDADTIVRMVKRGKTVKVRLRMEAKNHGMVPSANVVAELKGRELPDEVVVISGHLDSWDVGQGAHDDGSGCVMAMEALTMLRKLNLRPRRTIRVVLWTNEENGLRGAREYAKDHADELPKHVAAIEADTGCFEPQGFRFEHHDKEKQARGLEQLQRLLGMLHKTGATKPVLGYSGADIRPMKKSGVALLGLKMDMSTYFNYHHTPADTLDKVNPLHLTQNTATMAAMAWLLAELPGRLGEKGALYGR